MLRFASNAGPGEYHAFEAPGAKLAILACGSLACSAAYTLLQESLYRSSKFTAHGWLTCITFTMYAVFGWLEMTYHGLQQQRNGALVVYGSVSLLAVAAAYLTNVGLHLVPYTVKIVVKSCRILPVMGVSVALQGRRYATAQYVAAVAMVAGVSTFLAGSPEGLAAADGMWLGVLLLLVSLSLDALVSNLEERCFFRSAAPAPRVEVIAHMSTFAAAYAFVVLVGTGEVALLVKDPSQAPPLGIWVGIVMSSVAGYCAMSLMLTLIDEFGVATTEVVKTLRKVLQVVLSFVLFPKPVSKLHVLGGLLTLGALYLFSMKRVGKVKAKATPKAASVPSTAFSEGKRVSYNGETKGTSASVHGGSSSFPGGLTRPSLQPLPRAV